MPTLPDSAKAILDKKTFATIGTLMPDGTPQLSVVWVTHDGDDVLVSTAVGRQKQRNLERDPRATVLAFDPENPYSYVEVRGTARMLTEGGRELIDDLCEKYRGMRPYPWDAPDAVRVVVRITPDKVVANG